MITEWSVAADAAVVCVLLREESIGVESRPLGSVEMRRISFPFPCAAGDKTAGLPF
jgi:hypothetical protein